ncbi:putative DNA binding domain-containing protein [bacterium]|nr:putative DNA binding domain-containing protein [bacterium]
MEYEIEKLLERIRLGEDTGVEFKEVRFSGKKLSAPTRNQIAKELTAMANAKGGWLIFGVNDKSKEILGVEEDRLEDVKTVVGEVCVSTAKPEMPFDLYTREIENSEGELKILILVHVDEGLFVYSTPEGYFHRAGESSRPMNTEYLVRLHQERSQSKLKRFEQLPVPQTSVRDLDPDLYRQFVSQNETDQVVALLKRNLLVKTSDHEVRASVAGILMGSKEPRRHFPNAYIQAVRYRGTQQDSHFQVDARDLTGPLNQQIIDAFTFFQLHNKTAATKEVGRIDISQFSGRAVFEALVNAVAHRDYAVDYAKVRFFIFDDRIEICSPGGLINSMSLDSLDLRTATRNELLTNLLTESRLPERSGESLGRVTLMERRGDGVKIIKGESKKISGRDPVYRLIDDAEIQLIIYAAELPNQE